MAKPRRPFPWVPLFIFAPAVLPFAVLGACGLAFLSGVAVVHDTSGHVAEAVVIDSLGRVPMRRLPFGVFIGKANADGDAVLTCRDSDQVAFVSPGPGMIATVDGCPGGPPHSSPPQEN